MGLGEDASDGKKVKACLEDLSLITGQKAVITKFKKSISNFKTSPIKHAYNLGILNEKVIAAHCNVIEDGDLELLAESKAFPVFCPTTHGIAGKPMNTNFLSELNVDWGIGTDCSGGNDDYDMLEEMRTALVLNNSVAKKNFIKTI